MWSLDNLDSDLAMTTHWIVQDEKTGVLSLKTVLITFHYISCKHTGEELSKLLLSILDDAKIPVEKVSLTQA